MNGFITYVLAVCDVAARLIPATVCFGFILWAYADSFWATDSGLGLTIVLYWIGNGFAILL